MMEKSEKKEGRKEEKKEGRKEGRKTVRNSKRDVLNFSVSSKSGWLARELVLNGLRVDKAAEKLAAWPGAETSVRIAKATIKTWLSDLQLEPGSFSGSRGIALAEKDGVYRVADEKLRRKLKKAYRDFYELKK